MSWDYRIIRAEAGGESLFSIHEVYYSDKSRPMWTASPAPVIALSAEEIKEVLAMMQKAFERPILQVVGDALVEWKPK